MIRLRASRWLILTLVLAALAGPVHADGVYADGAIDTLLSQADEDAALTKFHNIEALRKFYASRSDAPAWWRNGAWSDQARQAAAMLQSADSQGLNPDDYLVNETSRLPDQVDPATATHIDAVLSAGMLRYISDVRSGRVVPREVDSDYAVDPARPDAAAVLADGLATNDFAGWLTMLPPADPAYRRLTAALLAYRKIAATAPWPQLPDGPTLKEEAAGPEVATLRRQLQSLGDLTDNDQPNTAEFDAAIEAAVRRFQQRNGLKPDGAVGAQTRAALNISPSERADQIAVNLERLRWFPFATSGRLIVINIGAFELRAFTDGKTVLKMPVIAGKASWRTPVFPDEVTALTFLPSWTVPPKIARQEILPKVKRNLDYLAKENMKVYSGWDANACEVNPHDVDWKSQRPATLQHKFVQQPGPSNALGRLRFTLHNEFGIFLHDTPAKKLFTQDVRSFSHGCIRVGDATALATFVLDGDPDWPAAAIEAAVNGNDTKTVLLRKPVPADVTYLTAWVDEDGSVQFRRDVYHRDRPLFLALSKGGSR